MAMRVRFLFCLISYKCNHQLVTYKGFFIRLCLLYLNRDYTPNSKRDFDDLNLIFYSLLCGIMRVVIWCKHALDVYVFVCFKFITRVALVCLCDLFLLLGGLLATLRKAQNWTLIASPLWWVAGILTANLFIVLIL